MNTKSIGYAAAESKTPTLIKGFHNNIVQVEMGLNHSALVTTNGELYTWGEGGYGTLGHNDGIYLN
jgi:alpha-tubulin suppressor-like RCC1 family protein